MPYAEIIAELPAELRSPMARLVDVLSEEFALKKTDFEDLKAIVRDLGHAQQRTEVRMEELAQAQRSLAEAQHRTELRVEGLTQAQQRTEVRMEELAQAQQRTEVRMEELAQAQQRTEVRMEELAQAQQRTEVRMEELAQAQQRTEVRVEQLALAQQQTQEAMKELAYAQRSTDTTLAEFRRTFTAQVGGLGARWGLQAEEAFRQGIRSILQEVGFTTGRFLDYDAQGMVFGYPDQIELDIVIQNGKVLVIEIKSSLDKGSLYQFARKVDFYAQKTGRQITRKLVVTPYAENRAKEVGMQLGIEICTDVNMLN